MRRQTKDGGTGRGGSSPGRQSVTVRDATHTEGGAGVRGPLPSSTRQQSPPSAWHWANLAGAKEVLPVGMSTLEVEHHTGRTGKNASKQA